MHNFHVSLVANVSFASPIDTSLHSRLLRDVLCKEGIYSKELISVSLNPILGTNAKKPTGLQEKRVFVLSCNYWFSYK